VEWQIPVALVRGGFVCGVVILFVNAFFFRLSGLPLGRRALQAHLRAALAWGAVPATLAAIVSLAAAVGVKLAGIESSQPARITVAVGSAAIMLVLWALVITVATVRRVQHFGTGRAIANMAIGWVGVAMLAIVIRTFIVQHSSRVHGADPARR
jgi:uncharacterized membrane protein